MHDGHPSHGLRRDGAGNAAPASGRRRFLGAAALLPFAATGGAAAQPAVRDVPGRRSSSPAGNEPLAARPGDGPVVVASGNGLGAVAKARELLLEGRSPTVAVVEGVALVEADPEDASVGYGGLPNEMGVVELDASVMDGTTHKAGAVAALQGVKHAARVALEVLRRTDHVLLVGEGARRFALDLGFPDEDLLTPRAREWWLRWRANRGAGDDHLDEAQMIELEPDVTGRATPLPDPALGGPIPFTWGTIHCGAVDASGRVGACTTTSGLSWKIPGRVGDSPIVGAGMFVDGEVGSAGGTGRGESAIQSCAAFQVVEHMRRGMAPTEACLETLRFVASRTKRADLLDAAGRPNFGLQLYALRRDGAFGAANLRGVRGRPARFAVADAAGARLEDAATLFELDPS